MQTAAQEERIAEPIEGGMFTSHPARWRMAAALVVILPAAGTAFGARSMLNAFQEMALRGVKGGIGSVSPAIDVANPPFIGAALAAALIAGVMAVILARKPNRAVEFPGMPAALLVAILACVPALLLWTVESYPLDVLAGRVEVSGIAEAVQHLENLLTGTMIFAITVIGFAVITWRLSLNPSRMRQDVRAWPRATVWAGAAVLLLCLAAVFYARSSYLYDAALRGSL